MYLGLNRPDNEIITTEQFNAYTQEVLDTMFDGYTISDAVGNWKGEREQTKIVSICTEYKDLVQKPQTFIRNFLNRMPSQFLHCQLSRWFNRHLFFVSFVTFHNNHNKPQ